MTHERHRINFRIASLLTVALVAVGLLLAAAAPSRADEHHRDRRQSEVRNSLPVHRDIPRNPIRVHRRDRRAHRPGYARTVLRTHRFIRSGHSRAFVRYDRDIRHGRTWTRTVVHHERFHRRVPSGIVLHRDRDRFIRLGRSETFVRHGRFYHHRHGGYVPAPAPIGAFLLNLPLGSVRFTVGGQDYWRFDGVFFQAAPRGWAVASPPEVEISPQPPVQAGAIVVDVPSLNVRTGPGLAFSVINQAVQGEELIVEGNAPGWYYVRLPGRGDGWVMARYTEPGPLG